MLIIGIWMKLNSKKRSLIEGTLGCFNVSKVRKCIFLISWKFKNCKKLENQSIFRTPSSLPKFIVLRYVVAISKQKVFA